MFAGTGWLKRRITSSKTADSPVPTRTSCLLPILRKICKLKDAEVLLQGLGLAQKTTKFGHQIHIRQKSFRTMKSKKKKGRIHKDPILLGFQNIPESEQISANECF